MLPKKLLRRRLKVAVTQCLEIGLSDSNGGHCDDDVLPVVSRGTTSLNWADQPNPAFPEDDIFVGNLPLASTLSGRRAPPTRKGTFTMGSCWDPLPTLGNNSLPRPPSVGKAHEERLERPARFKTRSHGP